MMDTGTLRPLRGHTYWSAPTPTAVQMYTRSVSLSTRASGTTQPP